MPKLAPEPTQAGFVASRSEPHPLAVGTRPGFNPWGSPTEQPFPPSPLRHADHIPQRPHPRNRQLDLVARGQPLADLHAAASGDRAGRQQLTRQQLLAERGVGDDLPEWVAHPGGAAVAPDLAVDPHLGGQRLHPGQHLVGGDDDRAEAAGEVLGLHRAETAGHLGILHVAGAEIVQHHEAADRGNRFLGRGVADGVCDHDPEFEFVIERLGVGRPGDRRALGQEAEVVAHVVDRTLVPQRFRAQRRKIAPGRPLVGGDDRAQTGHETPHQAARCIDRVPFIEHEIAERERVEWQLRIRLDCAMVPGEEGGERGQQLARLLAQHRTTLQKGDQVPAGRVQFGRDAAAARPVELQHRA